MTEVNTTRSVSTWLFVGCGAWLATLGLYFIFLRPPLLPEDARFIGASLVQIHAAVPGLAGWLSKVFTVMGGFMAGAGVLTVFVASVAVRSRSKGTFWVLAVTGSLTVALMSAVNFALASAFQWLLLVPALVWVAGLAAYINGR